MKRCARAAYRALSFLLGIAASAVLVCALAYTVLTHTGHQALPVLSGSMEPTMKTGSLAFVKPIPADRVRQGDVVTFEHPRGGEGTLITHRVHRVERVGGRTIYTTKGDANRTPDPWRLEAAGTVGLLDFDVPYAGYVVVHLGLRDVRVAILLSLCGAFLLLALISIWRPRRDRPAPPAPASLTVLSPGPGHPREHDAAASGRFTMSAGRRDPAEAEA